MFANTVFSTIYQSIATLINPRHKAYTQELERKIDSLNSRIEFLEADNTRLYDEASRSNEYSYSEDSEEENRNYGDRDEVYRLNNHIDDLIEDNKALRSVNKLISRELSALEHGDLQKENETLKRDFWDLAKTHNQLKNDYDELKKHDDWLNDMLLDGSELVTGIDAPIVEHDTLKVAAI
jgi:chaperonin cofactor prefoldin